MILERFKERIPLLVWGLVIGTLLGLPLKIISLGYLPSTDGLRHVAKVISGKPWSEILVMHPDLTTDHNPGWHVILGWVHQLTQWNADGLVIFSVCFLFLVFNVAGVAFLRRPEAWLLALLIVSLALVDLLPRSLYGRPFTFTAAVVIVLLHLGGKTAAAAFTLPQAAIATVLIAAAVWIHGAWYLLALPLAAFFLAGRKRAAVTLSVCWLAGAILGACLTGHPVDFLKNAVRMGQYAFASAPVERLLVTEFRSFDGEFLAVLLVLLTLLWGGEKRWEEHRRNPVFWLMLLSWMLGFKAARFWSDWGSPALMVWLAGQLNDFWEDRVPADSLRRLAWVAALCATLFLAVTADHNRRWTRHLDTRFLSSQDPENAEWLPGPGGIIYNADMRLFYETFYKNPQAPWRYVLGYEPALMTPENLAIYRKIQLNNGAPDAWTPWIEKMRTEDRLFIRNLSSQPPGISALEWKEVSQIWIGRRKKELPVSHDNPTDARLLPALTAP